MKSLFSLIIVVMLGFVTHITQALPQSTFPPALSAAIKSANIQSASAYLNVSVELIILGEENICSRNQALMILKNFFEKNPPAAFVVLFEGGKENSQYAIGKLTAKTGVYRMYFLMKGQIIHQIRIEKEDGN
jgi:hypothetical protein